MSPMTLERLPRRPEPVRGATATLALLGALVPAALLAATVRSAVPLAAVPTVIFGVPAMTAPALYVAMGLRGHAPPLTTVAGALGRGLLALALVQLGLAAPVGFLVATATPSTARTLIAGAMLIAGAVAALTLDGALVRGDATRGAWRAPLVWAWMTITAVIAARLYLEIEVGALS